MGNIYQYIKSTEDFYIVSSKLKETDIDESCFWTRYSLYYPGGVRDTIVCSQDFRNENEYVVIHNDVLDALQNDRKYQKMVVDELRKKYNILMTIIHKHGLYEMRDGKGLAYSVRELYPEVAEWGYTPSEVCY